jgi:hypothetical protein
MLEIIFEINGKRVDPDCLGNVLEQAILQSIKDYIQKKLGAIRCPEHGQAPKVICKGKSVKDLSFEVTGCCQKLIDIAKAQLK